MRAYSVALGLFGVVLSSPGIAEQTTQVTGVYQFNIPAGPLGDALNQLARLTGLQVLVASSLITGLQSDALIGTFSAEEGLRRLLAPTALQVKFVNARTVAITSAPSAAPGATDSVAPAGVEPSSGTAGTEQKPESDSSKGKNLHRQSLIARWLGVAAVCGSGLYAGSACAQQVAAASVAAEPASASAQGATSLQEIVVTAEKRSEDIEKAPVAVSAITSADLQALGVTTAEDLSSVVPNFSAAPNANGSTVAIRGIVSSNQSLNGNSEVGYTEDGVGLVNMRGAFDGMYDVNRVEVLRGPQGTLYGANANAGDVNVITNKPDLTAASASGSIGFGNYQEVSSSGALNIPLSDTFGFRAAVDEERHEGYVYLTTNNSRFDDRDFLAGRVHLLWKPTNNFSALLTFETQHNGGAGVGGSGSSVPVGLYAVQQGITPFKYAAMPGQMALDETINSTTLTLNWSLPVFDVTYIGNLRFDSWQQSDGESIYGPDASYCQNTTAATCFDPLINNVNYRQDSDELRFARSTGPLQWTLGLYYVRYDAHLTQADEYVVLSSQPKPTQWTLLDEPGYESESKAAYGQVTWKISDQLSLVGGLRYQHDMSILPWSPNYSGAPGSIVHQQCMGCTVTTVYNGFGEWGKTTWRAGLNYNLTPQSFLFVSVATGYEAGGFSLKQVEPFNPTYNPENLTNYEIGWKNKLFDNRAQINADVFYMDYSDLQVSASLTLNNLPVLLTTNAGRAAIKGLELESTFLVTPYDQLSLNATVLRADFTSFYLPTGDGFGPVAGQSPTNYTGNELPYAPHFTARLGYQHTFTLSGSDALVARADSSYSTHYWLDYHDYSAIAQGEYTRTALSLSWQRRNEGGKTFTTQVYVHNLENKDILSGAQPDNNAPNRDFSQYGRGYYLPPRTFGIQLSGSL